MFLGAYPITPASDILHELSKLKHFGVTTFQAEDEIAGIGAALGASYGGHLGVTSTSGPGRRAQGRDHRPRRDDSSCRCSSIDVQRGGPSTGLPTKTEQSDLLQAMYGRNGEAPLPVVAAQSPSDCFDAAIEAARIAITYRTPVMLLSDGYLANGSEPWRLPDVAEPAGHRARLRRRADDAPTPSRSSPTPATPETLARPWAPPGVAGLEHRIGGLEKQALTGAISYDSDNHDLMVRTRQAKVEGIATSIPDLVVDDPSGEARLLVIGWGSTYGPIGAGCPSRTPARPRDRAGAPAPPQPVPARTSARSSRRYDRVVCPEMNLGQLASLLRDRYLVDVQRLTTRARHAVRGRAARARVPRRARPDVRPASRKDVVDDDLV